MLETQVPVLSKLEQRRIDTLRKILDVGDIQRFSKVLDSAATSTPKTLEVMLIVSQMFLGVGDFSNAIIWIKNYLKEKPDDFDGWVWYHIIHAYSQPGAEETLRLGVANRNSLLKKYFANLAPEVPRSPQGVLQHVITDRTISFCFRRELAGVFIYSSINKNQRKEVTQTLSKACLTWPIRERLLWIGLSLFYFAVTDEILDHLLEVSRSDELEMVDLVGIINLFNTIVSEGDKKAFLKRFHCLSTIYSILLGRMEKLSSSSDYKLKEFDGPSKAKTNKIAVYSGPLLSVHHSPTSRVLEMSAALKRDYGYEVRIFATGSLSYRPDAAIPAIGASNSAPVQLGLDTVMFNDAEIEVWTSFLDDSQHIKHYTTASEIMKFDPDAVIIYSDCHPIQHLLFEKIPTILQPSNGTPPVGPADVYLSAWREENLENSPNGQEWPKNELGKPIFGPQLSKIVKPQWRIDREEIVAESKLLLAIVGNHLTTEVRGEFSNRLCQFLLSYPDVHVLVIGTDDKQEFMQEELSDVASQIHCIGFSENLTETLTGCDIYLNPERQGGGTGVALAMSVGCAIVSLNYGDGATYLDKQDLADSFDAYFLKLKNLVSDEVARHEMQSRMAKTVNEICNFEAGMKKLETVIRDLSSNFRCGK